MPRRFSCVCGYQWCTARDVCSWAWTRVDAAEGAYHVKAGTTGTDQYEEYRQFTRAREVRERGTNCAVDGREQGSIYVDVPHAENLVREWRLIAERYRNVPNVTTDPF